MVLFLLILILKLKFEISLLKNLIILLVLKIFSFFEECRKFIIFCFFFEFMLLFDMVIWVYIVMVFCMNFLFLKWLIWWVSLLWFELMVFLILLKKFIFVFFVVVLFRIGVLVKFLVKCLVYFVLVFEVLVNLFDFNCVVFVYEFGNGV